MHDGVSLRANLKSAERISRRQVERLHMECPPAWVYVWEWFLELCMGRQPGYRGPAAITYLEIASWSSLTGIRLTPDEVAILKALDMVFLKVSEEVKNG